MTFRPCVVCGEPSEGSRCSAHPRTSRHENVLSSDARGYDRVWRRLSERARRLQPFCSDCGTVEDLTADHLPGAWQRVAEGKRLRLGEDVDVVCRSCNSLRGRRRDLGG